MNLYRSFKTYSIFVFALLLSSASYIYAETTIIPASDWGSFDGAWKSEVTENSNYFFSFPTSTPEAPVQEWAGFGASEDTSSWAPFSFAQQGSLTVNAGVPDGGTATLRFVLERLAYDTEGNGATSTLPKVDFSGYDYVDNNFWKHTSGLHCSNSTTRI